MGNPFLSPRAGPLSYVAHGHLLTTKTNLFGWITDARAKPHSPFKQAQWLNACIRDANISEIDWYRLAQNKAQWTKLILHAHPKETVLLEREREMDSW